LGMSKAAAGTGGGFCGVPLPLAAAGGGAGAAGAGEGASPAAALAPAAAGTAAGGFTSGMGGFLSPAKPREISGEEKINRAPQLRRIDLARWRADAEGDEKLGFGSG